MLIASAWTTFFFDLRTRVWKRFSNDFVLETCELTQDCTVTTLKRRVAYSQKNPTSLLYIQSTVFFMQIPFTFIPYHIFVLTLRVFLFWYRNLLNYFVLSRICMIYKLLNMFRCLFIFYLIIKFPIFCVHDGCVFLPRN